MIRNFLVRLPVSILLLGAAISNSSARAGDATPPKEPILAVRVLDLNDKEAVLAEGRRGVFTIAHFDGYPAVLVELRSVGTRVLRQAIEDAWLACAPPPLASAFLAAGKR